jgi:hypothetical protein
MARLTQIFSLSLLALAGPATAALPAGSVYTPLNLDTCRVIARAAEGDSTSWRCPGRAGIALFVSANDDRFDLDAGVDNGVWESLGGFNRLGPRVEWRLRGRTPVALIYRYFLTGADGPGGSVLAVESIGRPGRPGCLIALIGGAVPGANALARARADSSAARFRCGVDTVERRGVD